MLLVWLWCSPGIGTSGINTGQRCPRYELVDDVTMKPLELRWRIVDGRLPLQERHLRSLNPLELSPPLLAWIRSRLEWAMDNLMASDTGAVLCLAVNPLEDVVVSLEPLREPPKLSSDNLLVSDGQIAGVRVDSEPLDGVVWLEREGVLYASAVELTSAVDTLAQDILRTLGEKLIVAPVDSDAIQQVQSAFVLSNEFGLLPLEIPSKTSQESEAPLTDKLIECLGKVFPRA